MCESGNKCYDGESCVTRVDRLKRNIWALMIWVSVLSLGLGASITLHFTYVRRSDTPVRDNTVLQTPRPQSSQLTTYKLANETQIMNSLVWQKTNGDNQSTLIKIEEDGNYFLFLKVTLQDRNHGVSYTVTLIKNPNGNTASDLIVGNINSTENSTGFMGIGVYLTVNTLLNVTCIPPQKLDVVNTYLGLIWFPEPS